MLILMSLKHTADSKPFQQVIVSENIALNNVRTIYLHFNRMDETSADLRAMKDIEDIKKGNVKGYKNPKNNKVVSFQLSKQN